jgi:hypothetical protein
MKLLKKLQNKNKKDSTPYSRKSCIKNQFPVHTITCENHNRPIPCPFCGELDFLRGWDDDGRTLALCYFCGTVFYCDTNEIVDVLTDNPSRWAPRVIAIAGGHKVKALNKDWDVKSEDCLVITQDWLEDVFEQDFFKEDFFRDDLFEEGSFEENPKLKKRAKKKEIKKRYELGVRPIRLTLNRIIPTTEFQSVIKSLRNDGWKDWHFLMAILNLVFQYRMDKLGLKGEKRINYIKEMVALKEDEDATKVPLTKFTIKNLYHHLYLSAVATVRDYGYKIKKVDFSQLAEILHELNYWEYDVPHEPIFDL